MILFIYSRVKLCFSSKEIYTTVICGFHNTSVTFCSFIHKGLFFFSTQRRAMILKKKKKGRFSNSVHIVDGLDSLTQIELHSISGL